MQTVPHTRVHKYCCHKLGPQGKGRWVTGVTVVALDGCAAHPDSAVIWRRGWRRGGWRVCLSAGVWCVCGAAAWVALPNQPNQASRECHDCFAACVAHAGAVRHACCFPRLLPGVQQRLWACQLGLLSTLLHRCPEWCMLAAFVLHCFPAGSAQAHWWCMLSIAQVVAKVECHVPFAKRGQSVVQTCAHDVDSIPEATPGAVVSASGIQWCQVDTTSAVSGVCTPRGGEEVAIRCDWSTCTSPRGEG